MTLCALVSQPDRSTEGTQTRTVTSFGAVSGMVNFASHSDLNAIQNALRYTFGASDSNLNQSSICSVVANGSSQDANTQQHIAQTGRVGMRLNANLGQTTTISRTEVSAFPTDGVTLNVTQASSARVSNQLLFGGTSTTEFITIDENQTEGQFTDATITAIPDAIIVFTNNDDMNSGGPHTGFASTNICFVKVADSGATITYAGQNHTARRSGTSEAIAAVYNDGIRTIDPTETTANTDGHFTLSFPNSTTLRMTTVERTDDAAPATIGFLLLYLDGYDVSVGVADIPTSSGVQSISLDGSFTPQMVMFGTNQLETVSTAGSIVSGSLSGSHGVACVTRPPGVAAGNLERCTNSRSQAGLSTTSAENFTSSSFLDVFPDDGSNTNRITGTFDSFGSGSVSVNFTRNASTVKKFPYIAISAAQASSGVDASVTESYDEFSETANVSLSANVTSSITEIHSSFTESVSVNITPDVNVSASITESNNDFSEAVQITITEAGQIASTITETYSDFSESIGIDVQKDISMEITESYDDFSESISLSVSVDTVVNPRNIIRINKKINRVIIR